MNDEDYYIMDNRFFLVSLVLLGLLGLFGMLLVPLFFIGVFCLVGFVHG